MKLRLLPETYAICRLSAEESWPAWAQGPGLVSVTRTDDELSVVCLESVVPTDVRAERGWSGMRVAGTLDFGLTGILSSLSAPLAEAGISLFALSTFDTDYLLVKKNQTHRAQSVLKAQGWEFL